MLQYAISQDNTTQYILDQIVEKSGFEKDVTIRILGSLTPIFGLPEFGYPLSEECSQASWTYLANMFLSELTDPENMFAISSKCIFEFIVNFFIKKRPQNFFSVFDSSGKIPDGIYADTYEFCERLEKFYAGQFGFTCDSGPPEGVTLPFSLSSLRGLINIPYGNTIAYGSFPGCINVKKDFEIGDVHNPYNISHIYGQYVRLSINPNFSNIGGDKETRLAGIIASGGLLKPIIDQVFNSSAILSDVRQLSKIWKLKNN